MKYIFCKNCKDLIALTSGTKYCNCKQTSGRYTDEVNAVYSSEAVPIGVTSNEISKLFSNEVTSFNMFKVPYNSNTFRRADEP